RNSGPSIRLSATGRAVTVLGSILTHRRLTPLWHDICLVTCWFASMFQRTRTTATFIEKDNARFPPSPNYPTLQRIRPRLAQELPGEQGGDSDIDRRETRGLIGAEDRPPRASRVAPVRARCSSW